MVNSVDRKFKVGDFIRLPFEKDDTSKYLIIDNKLKKEYYNNPEVRKIHEPKLVTKLEVSKYYKKKIDECKEKVSNWNNLAEVYTSKMKDFNLI